MNRAEHLAWAKQRAIDEMEFYGEPQQGLTSLASDLLKHPETREHPAPQLGLMEMLSGRLSTKDEMRRFIEGCH